MNDNSVDVADRELEVYDAICDVLNEGDFTNADVIYAIGMLIFNIMETSEVDRETVFKDIGIVVDEVARIEAKMSKH